MARVREAAGKWESETSLSAAAASSRKQTPPPEEVRIDRAVSAFLAERAESSATSTQKKYKIMMKKLQAYSDAKGYAVIAQWAPIDVREFRQSWGVSPITSGKNMSIVKAFFEFALSNEWIARNPARLVKNPRARAGDELRTKERSPFSDDELKRMLDACETQYAKHLIRWSRKVHHRLPEPGVTANYRYKWDGQDLADFISVSVYTGLRISDVCTFILIAFYPLGSATLGRLRTAGKFTRGFPSGCKREFARESTNMVL